MYVVRQASLYPGHNVIVLPASFQVLNIQVIQGLPGAFILVDDRGPSEQVLFEAVMTGNEVPLESVRFGEYVGSFSMPYYGDSYMPPATFHVFGKKAGGAFTVNPNLRS